MRGGSGSGASFTWVRLAAWAAVACAALLAGAGLGFLARDLLGLGQPAVALAWFAGVALGLARDLARVRRRE